MSQGGSFSFRGSAAWEELNKSVISYLDAALCSFSDEYFEHIAEFKKKFPSVEFASCHRLDEISRACSDDLYRYAIYHRIELEETGNGKRFKVSGQALCSFLLKWVMLFRPVLIDEYWSDKDPSVTIEKEDVYRRCNELYALFVVAQVADLNHRFAPDSTPVIDSVTEYMESDQLEDFLYTLRYRIKHQDVFKGWLWKAFVNKT